MQCPTRMRAIWFCRNCTVVSSMVCSSSSARTRSICSPREAASKISMASPQIPSMVFISSLAVSEKPRFFSLMVWAYSARFIA